MLNPDTLLALIVFAACASWLQTLTGFAFALVFMSAITVTDTIGIEDGAIIVTLLMVVNAVVILAAEWRFVSGPACRGILPPALAGTVAGALILPVLLAKAAIWLKCALGVAVILSSLRLLRVPGGDDGPPGPFAYPLSGLAAGIMGGLFAVPGPPVVYTLQRHLRDQRRIRATLVTIFAVVSLARLTVTSLSSLPTRELLLTTLALLPVTIVATEAARRHPPPVSPQMARVVTVLLLVLTGIVLVLPAVASMRTVGN